MLDEAHDSLPLEDGPAADVKKRSPSLNIPFAIIVRIACSVQGVSAERSRIERYGLGRIALAVDWTAIT